MIMWAVYVMGFGSDDIASIWPDEQLAIDEVESLGGETVAYLKQVEITIK